MNTRTFQRSLAFSIIGTAFGLTAPGSVLAEHRCDNPQRMDVRRLCEYARQGPDALRHFIERTHGIYEGAYFYDYVIPTSAASVNLGAADRVGGDGAGRPAHRAEISARPLG
jgi:hypothetical protein